MKINIYRLDECFKAKGLCVVIDVLRAFTTAAFAFAAGAKEIIFVSSTDEALLKHRHDHSLLLMGEIYGKPIEGFHFGNSPAEIQNASLSEKRIVQRTSSGTQGVVRCRHVDQMLVASFVVAEATLMHIATINPIEVSFIVTGTQDGDDDLALAEYFQNRILGYSVAISPFLDRVRLSCERRTFADPTSKEFSYDDLELALQADRFSFAMEVSKEKDDLVAKQILIMPKIPSRVF